MFCIYRNRWWCLCMCVIQYLPVALVQLFVGALNCCILSSWLGKCATSTLINVHKINVYIVLKICVQHAVVLSLANVLVEMHSTSSNKYLCKSLQLHILVHIRKMTIFCDILIGQCVFPVVND